jgi:two-component system, NtrC family, sensor kinase
MEVLNLVFLISTKRYLNYFLLVFSFPAFAQKGEVFTIDSLPKNGILLQYGWKYKNGDNVEWARSDFDDTSWKTIDPTKDISKLPEVFNSNIKWLRLNFVVSKQLPKPLGISVSQAGASEIYLNGRLIHQFGHFDKNPDKVIAFDPLQALIHIPVDSIGQYHLAVRYALQPNIKYTQVFGLTKNFLFNATLFDFVPTVHDQMRFKVYHKGIDIFILGVVFMLFFLHLAFYLYQRNNFNYLLLSTYLLSSVVLRIFKLIGQNQNSVEDRYYSLMIANWALSVTLIFVATVYYRIAKERLDKYYYAFIIYFIVYGFIPSFTYGFKWQNAPLLFGTIFSFIVLIRLTRIGIKKKIKGFLTLNVVTYFALIGLLCITLAMRFLNYGITPTGYQVLKYGISPYLVDLVFNFGSIAVPIGLSLFMGIQGNETNKALNRQLIENEELKNKAIEHEQEKQHLLANQNELLEKQVSERTIELNQSIETLKETQNQLIQSEKLASLGELTAGIAHEIQNPLNFVNNFSEVSTELVDEMNEEIEKENLNEAKEIASDLKQNLEKINHHGKRAADIVKGMLQHSSSGSGKKEPTNINALADEYLRLAYHGLRAKDKSFNAVMKTDFDENLGNINIIPQDMGRVILNLITNAFYVVNEKNKQNISGYEPMVTVSTKKENNKIFISVKDNGNGIPEKIVDKIFQPFFTTKPTGQGTGLGLSLSYDIVKAHGGELKVETNEGEGSEFVIELPI